MRLPLSRDGSLLFATCGMRSFAYGFLSVILGLYLGAIGLSTTAIGWVFTAALAGGAVAPLFTGAVLAHPSLGWPFLLAGGLKVVYDLWIFAVFRKVKPPEEKSR